MSKNDTHIPDAFNELLKRYLLEQGVDQPPGSEGPLPEHPDWPDGLDGLDDPSKMAELEKLSEAVFAGNYDAVPPSLKEAEMLSKLKEKFAKSPGGGNEPGQKTPAKGSGDGPGAQGGGPKPGPARMLDWIWQNKLIVMSTSGLVAALALLFMLNTGYFSRIDYASNSGGETGNGRIEAPFDPNNPNDPPGEDRRGMFPPLAENGVPIDSAKLAADFALGPEGNKPIEVGPVPEKSEEMAATEATDSVQSARNFTNRSPIVDPDRSPVDLPFPVLQLFRELSPKPTTKKIAGQKDALILGRKGTLFAIPANSFAFIDGTRPTGQITIEIVEAYKKGDMIAANVPTVSPEHYLQSQGMVNITASSEGKPLKLIEGKNIYIEFNLPEGWDNPDMELYKGRHDEMGHMTWTTAGGYTGSMVALPINKINFQQFRSPGRGNKLWDEYISQLNSPRYEGTLIATWEFVERLKVARRMGYMAQILEMYMNNPNNNMYEVDQMVAYHLRGNYRNYEYKNQATLGMEDFERFYRHALKRSVQFSNYGVDLEASNARELLAKENLTEGRINSIMRSHQLRKQYLKEINGPIEYKIQSATSKNIAGLARIPGTDQYCWQENTSYVKRRRSGGFRIDRLGWFNLDQIIAPPNLPLSLDVNIQGENIEDGNTRVFLVLQGAKSVVTGKLRGDGKYSFGRLARGTSAKLFCLKYDGMTPFMAEQDIRLSENQSTILELEPTSIKAMKAKLESYNVY